MRRPLAPGLCLAALLLGLTGCADDSPDDQAAAPEETSPTSAAASTTEESTPTPTRSREPSTSTPKPSRTKPPATPKDPDSDPSRIDAALVPVAQMPGFNDQWRWDDATTTDGPGERPAGVCMQHSMTAIGAVAEQRRTFTSRLDRQATAVQVTAVFPDVRTAETSSMVLAAWQDKCEGYAARTPGRKAVSVQAPETTNTVVGPASGWMVTYRPVPGDPDAMWFNAEGFVRDGDTISYLVVTTPGMDYNYPADEEPIDLALSTAGRYLARSR